MLGWFRRAAPRSASALLAVAALGCSPEAPRTLPHVLLVTVDTLRPDYLGMNGYDRPTTPSIDALLGEGAYFEQAVSPVPRTTAALASLLTGAYPHATGVRNLTDRLPAGVTTLAEVMRGAGYRTTAVVTNRVLDRARGLDRGFDHYEMAPNYRIGAETTDRALAVLRPVGGPADDARPTFLWVHYIDPHVPYHPSEEAARSIDPGYDGPHALHFGWQRQPGEPADAHRPFPDGVTKREATHRNALPEEVNAHIRRLYAADVQQVDAEVGRLVDGVRARLGSDVLVVFAADHGESLGEHDFYWDHGDYVFSAGTRVPLGIVLPASHPLAGPRRCAGWVSLVDVVPTLLDLLPLTPPVDLIERLEGRSLVPCLEGRRLASEPVFLESGTSFSIKEVKRRQRNDVAGRFRAVVLDDWKLVFTPFLPDDDAWELYDLAADPDETSDLYRPDHPRVAALRPLLEAWIAKSPPDERPPPAPSERDAAALRELGYLE